MVYTRRGTRLLNEVVNPRQHSGEPRRRLFWDEYFLLCVWFDHQDNPLGFELSYDLAGDCRALRCMPGPDVEHYAVDDGESRTLRKATPILRVDHSRIDHAIASDFRDRSRSIDPEIARRVHEQIERYLGTTAPDTDPETDVGLKPFAE